MKHQFNVRLSPETLAIINTLAGALECSQADVVRQAVRLLARREGQSRPPSAEKLPKKIKKDGKRA